MATASTKSLDPRAVAFGHKLQGILDERGLSRRSFAKLVSPENPEGVRRAVHRHLAGVHMPSRLTRRHYELVLDLETGTLEPDDDDEESDPMEALMGAIRRLVREETEALRVATPEVEA